MCRLFIEADPELWTSKTKSMCIDGVVTSIRLENFFWTILEEIASRDQMTLTQMVTKLYLEALDADHDQGNFTSFLRVCAGRYLALIAHHDIPHSMQIPISQLDSHQILANERDRDLKKQRDGEVPKNRTYHHYALTYARKKL